MKKIISKNGKVIFSGAYETDKALVEAAIRAGANLYRANLAGTNLTGANLAGANLTGATITKGGDHD